MSENKPIHLPIVVPGARVITPADHQVGISLRYVRDYDITADQWPTLVDADVCRLLRKQSKSPAK